MRWAEEPTRVAIDRIAGVTEPAEARRARASGTRMAGCCLVLIGIRGVLQYAGTPQLAVDVLGDAALALLAVGLQFHSWASGFTRRDRIADLTSNGTRKC